MKQIIKILIFSLFIVGCNRDDFFSDDIPQEEITNIILVVTDNSTKISQSYNFNMGQTNLPEIKLTDGHQYTVKTIFMNGNDDETESIIQAKDEHFLLFDFPNSQIDLVRIDDVASTRSDSKKLGITTLWNVIKIKSGTSPILKLNLIHDAQAVYEEQNGTVWGSTIAGETDAEAVFLLIN